MGISGWTYQPWRGTFYPDGLPVRRQLAYVAARLSSVEVNGSELAVQHDARVTGDRALTTTTVPDLPLRHAVEVRHASFRDPSFTALLRHHGVALVLSDNPGTWPVFDEVTAPFAYVRLHGHEQLYASGYDEAALDAWAARVEGWAEAGLDVYVYCDNDAKVRAPYDAMGLLARLVVRGLVDPLPDWGE